MKRLRISVAEEKWLKGAIEEDIAAWEEWEGHPKDGLTKTEQKELDMLRKFAAEFEERIITTTE